MMGVCRAEAGVRSSLRTLHSVRKGRHMSHGYKCLASLASVFLGYCCCYCASLLHVFSCPLQYSYPVAGSLGVFSLNQDCLA